MKDFVILVNILDLQEKNYILNQVKKNIFERLLNRFIVCSERLIKRKNYFEFIEKTAEEKIRM